MRILLLGTRKRVIANAISLFRENGAEPVLMETQTVSLLRHFGFGPADPTTLIVNMGASLMTVMAVNKGELVFTLSYPEAGDLLTKTLMSEFNLSKEQAEVYKTSYGLAPDQADGKVRNALMPVVEMMMGNLRSANNFFATKTGLTGVERISLTGGSAALVGLVDVVRQNMGVEVVVADNFFGFTGDTQPTNQLAWGVALGLLKRKF
jgi:type IV pilus assembly protein PilM